MTKAIVSALLWGLLYFVTGYFLFSGSSDFSRQTTLSAISALSFFIGYRHGQRNPNNDALRMAFIWGLGASLAAWMFSSSTSDASGLLSQFEPILEELALASVGAFVGFTSGKTQANRIHS